MRGGALVRGVARLLAGLALLAAPAARAADAERESMEAIFEAMRFLLPLSVDAGQFGDPARREPIEQALALLSRSSAQLERHGRSRDAGYSYLSHALAVDARDIHQRYTGGYVQEARFLVQQLADTCVACHSMLPAESAPLRPGLASPELVAGLPLDQRAKLEYATRQFDLALGSYEALLAGRDLSSTDLDLLGYLDDYLELCIRVRRDLTRPAAALERFGRRADLTPVLAGQVARWIASLRELSRREPARGALDEARSLLREATDSKRFEDERDALVYYLQASGVLHRFVAAPGRSEPELGEAYYLIGVTETRVGRSFWLSQAEAYLEASIRAAPRAESARRAYDLLEEFLIAGYTGSAGTHVPPDIQARLDALRALVEPDPRAGDDPEA